MVSIKIPRLQSYLAITSGLLFCLTGSLQADEGSAGGLQVTLAWNANPESDIAGYRLYFGTESGTYSTMVDVGKVTISPLTLPAPGTYFAVVTAYNTFGLESLPSPELAFAVPVASSDVTDPTITGIPSDIVSLPDQAGGATAVVSWTAPSANDDIGVVSFTSDYSPGDTFPAGATTVTYTATDAAGNVATADFKVTVMSVDIWRSYAFGSLIFDELIAGDDSNPDGDMWSNLAEYALGLDPRRWDGDAQVSLDFSGQEMQFQLMHSAVLPDVLLTLESLRPPGNQWVTTASLAPGGTWEFDPSELQITSSPEGERIAVTVTKAIDGSQGEFFRLNVHRFDEP